MIKKSAIIFLMLSLYLPFKGWTQEAFQSVDISGMYEVKHPDKRNGYVIIQFLPSAESILYKQREYRRYKVSLWKQKDDTIRKLRDGLFGTYIYAAVIGDGYDTAILWYSPDEKEFKFNKIISIDKKRNIHIGSARLETQDMQVYSILEYNGIPNLHAEASINTIHLEGVYNYFHSATGKVNVLFKETDIFFSGINKEEIKAYSVTVLADVPGLGFSIVKEGLFGGSLPDDSFPFAGIQSINGESWLLWFNPAKPGKYRKSRIVSAYENGDIGIGLSSGEQKYIENTIFKRIADVDAKIDTAEDFIDLQGFYLTDLSGKETLVMISSTPLRINSNGRQLSLFKISSISIIDGEVSILFEGVRKNSFFTHLSLENRDGKFILQWYSLSMQVKEEHFIFDLTGNGSFKVCPLQSSEQKSDASFKKITAVTDGKKDE